MIDLSRLPAPSEKNISIRVKTAAERAIRHGHPWIFEDSITRQSHLGSAGDLAVIYDKDNNRFMAVGLYDPFSPIRVKILHSGTPERIHLPWFAKKLRAAQQLRQSLPEAQTNGYRLVHGESDGFPALVIDRYDHTLVIKLYTIAWLPHLTTLIAAMKKTIPFDNLVLRLSRAIQSSQHDIAKLYGLHEGALLLGAGDMTKTPFTENGLNFTADLQNGHKTGFFFDQRDNRQKLRALAQGRRVLDVFAYSGAFSVYALAGGAKSTLALDSSQPALDAFKSHVALNSLDPTRAQTMTADAFTGLQELAKARRRFSMLIVDPPSLANSRANLQNALTAYRRLLELSLPLLADDGILMMASCSSRVTMDMFTNLISRTATAAGHNLEITAATSHAIDHPIAFPEAEYLKAVFAILKP